MVYLIVPFILGIVFGILVMCPFCKFSKDKTTTVASVSVTPEPVCSEDRFDKAIKLLYTVVGADFWINYRNQEYTKTWVDDEDNEN